MAAIILTLCFCDISNKSNTAAWDHTPLLKVKYVTLSNWCQAICDKKKENDVRLLHNTTINKCSQANLPSNSEAPLCCYWLFGLMRLVYYFCGIMIRSDRFCSVCCGCQIDYVTQTWDDGVADASRSAKILVYGRYLPHLVALRTHTQNTTYELWNPSHFWTVSAVFPTSLQPVMTSHQISFHLKMVVFKEDGESVKYSAASTSRCNVTHSNAPIILFPTSF